MSRRSFVGVAITGQLSTTSDLLTELSSHSYVLFDNDCSSGDVREVRQLAPHRARPRSCDERERSAFASRGVALQKIVDTDAIHASEGPGGNRGEQRRVELRAGQGHLIPTTREEI